MGYPPYHGVSKRPPLERCSIRHGRDMSRRSHVAAFQYATPPPAPMKRCDTSPARQVGVVSHSLHALGAWQGATPPARVPTSQSHRTTRKGPRYAHSATRPL